MERIAVGAGALGSVGAQLAADRSGSRGGDAGCTREDSG
jgi:hypothetical protein